MRSVEELIKEVGEEVNRDYESGAKNCIKNCILEIVRQQEIIKTADETIRKMQTTLKELVVKQVPTNFLI
jgi:ribosomal protein S20